MACISASVVSVAVASDNGVAAEVAVVVVAAVVLLLELLLEQDDDNDEDNEDEAQLLDANELVGVVLASDDEPPIELLAIGIVMASSSCLSQ